MSGIGKKSRRDNVALKLDMSKAYDRVSWLHITHVLRKFGFGEQFIDRIWNLLSNVWFSTIINGASCGFFKSARGLRQGDPLPPALFVIGAEVLSRCPNNLALQSGFVGFTVPHGCPPITYLAFADDVIIFANGLSTSLKRIMCKSLYFGELNQAILGRILSRKSKLLPSGGKIILIKHVLASILLCYPVEEGGAGFWRLRDVYKAFLCKLWWRFRTTSSLWATYLRAKYCKEAHPCQVTLSLSATTIWRRMWNVSRQVELSMLWQVNEGSCHFWKANKVVDILSNVGVTNPE
ncbi:uncharacterized protein [Coffea arabica]|uniref:Reverse transcriptase domain-containing protein n=1 Tax=Coffea arabica TaxID=13443 RepID=A0ABM4WPL3_COFAR